MGALVAGRRYCAAPRLHQPLSHGAKRRDSSPFRGAEGVGRGLRRLRICLPRCRYLRLADARKGRRPRRPAFAGLPGWVRRSRPTRPTPSTFDTAHPPPSTAQRMQFRGHSPRTILYGRTHVVHHPRPGGRGSPPLRCEVGRFRLGTGVVRRQSAVSPPIGHAKKDRSSDRSFLVKCPRALGLVQFSFGSFAKLAASSSSVGM